MKTNSLRCNLITKDCFSLGMLVLIGAAIMVVMSAVIGGVSAEESTGTNFYLKASKSVPRIGRRSEYDNFFLKASKSVPRIGRRREMAPLTEGRDYGSWPWFRTADNIPGPSRRSDYFVHEEAPQPLSWNSVEKTMEESPELWKPDIWSKNSENFPLRDEFEMPHLERRASNQYNTNKEVEEPRSQPEV